MPENLFIIANRSNFVAKMEYEISNENATDIVMRVVTAAFGRYVEMCGKACSQIVMSVCVPNQQVGGCQIVVHLSGDGKYKVGVSPLEKALRSGEKLWEFIEDNLPDYYHRDDILRYDILSRFVDDEDMEADDVMMVREEFNSDKDKAREELDDMEKEFAYESLLAWLGKKN